MPWCNTCDRFLSPPTVRPDGTCPACGQPVEAPPGGEALTSSDEEYPPVPLHLKLLGLALLIYLGWRLIQGIVWLVGRL